MPTLSQFTEQCLSVGIECSKEVTCQESISTYKYPLMTKDCWEMVLLGDKVILKMTETPEPFHQRDFQAGFMAEKWF